MRTHSSEKRFKCDRCSYETNQKASLNAHVGTKHDNLWFRCEDCDFKTRKKGYLKKHKQYQHEGMVFYKCDQCSYRSLKKPNSEF